MDAAQKAAAKQALLEQLQAKLASAEGEDKLKLQAMLDKVREAESVAMLSGVANMTTAEIQQALTDARNKEEADKEEADHEKSLLDEMASNLSKEKGLIDDESTEAAAAKAA